MAQASRSGREAWVVVIMADTPTSWNRPAPAHRPSRPPKRANRLQLAAPKRMLLSPQMEVALYVANHADRVCTA